MTSLSANPATRLLSSNTRSLDMLRLHLAALLLSSSCFPTTLSSPPPTQNNNTDALPIPNDLNPDNSTLTDIDARFRLIPSNPPATSTPLQPISTYLNAITWLAHLAQSNFRSLAPPSETQSVAPWTDVAITWTRQPSGGACETRFLIWGLWLALEWFRRNEEGFVANGFQLLWDAREVGTLAFGDPAAAASSRGAARDSSAVTTTRKRTTVTMMQNAPANVGSVNLTAASNTNLALTFTRPPAALPLSPPDFFHPLASALVLLSAYPSAQRTHWFYARPKNGCRGFLHLGGPGVERRQWPYLRNEDAVLLVYEIADFAARGGGFAELDVRVEMDGWEVARGEVRVQLRDGGGGAGAGGGGGAGAEGSVAVV
ncbi:MAG: hypothetical protein OHK93_001671 [Ramalina farinacea]|uniref:Uncharacterized protein n=1 Tax=Ramalina farinacea TaxID=258253 RepID=A0AA43QPY3_9LECA|nr:hypothetical protein [Ramalina farinacea]